MIRSLRTGVTGLLANQQRLDAVGNNIANVNTVGFKRTRAAFRDVLGQRLVAPGSASIGGGTSLLSANQVWTQGNLEATGVPTDLALGGSGFFVAKGPGGISLTRAGTFAFDKEGYLSNATGQRVQGWSVGPDGSALMGALQDVQIDPNQTTQPRETSKVALSGNLSADLKPGTSTPATVSTSLYDSQGKAHTLLLTYTPAGDNKWSLEARLEGSGQPLATTEVTFDVDGKISTPKTLELAGTFGESPDDVGVTLDLSAVTQFGGSTTARVTSSDGYAAGKLVGYEFDRNGKLQLLFSNGQQQAISQLAIGDVANASGLEGKGDNLYNTTAASGEITFGRAGQEIDTLVAAGALEMANVDLATEFTDMIVAQRGYQASARVITTSDELLQEVVQLKR